jgi:hypothetical protein
MNYTSNLYITFTALGSPVYYLSKFSKSSNSFFTILSFSSFFLCIASLNLSAVFLLFSNLLNCSSSSTTIVYYGNSINTGCIYKYIIKNNFLQSNFSPLLIKLIYYSHIIFHLYKIYFRIHLFLSKNSSINLSNYLIFM